MSAATLTRRSNSAAPRNRNATDHASRRSSEPGPKGLEYSLLRLSEEERQAILSVVKRDLEVRCMEKHRLK